MIPGSNLLNMAMGLIATQPVTWIRSTGRTQNALGQWVTAYAEPVVIRASFQPLDGAKYETLGLDLEKRYFVLYTSAAVKSIERDESPDLVQFSGRRYQCEADAGDWLAIDGWRGVLCIDVGAAQ